MNKLHNVKTIFILSVKIYVLLRHRPYNYYFKQSTYTIVPLVYNLFYNNGERGWHAYDSGTTTM